MGDEIKGRLYHVDDEKIMRPGDMLKKGQWYRDVRDYFHHEMILQDKDRIVTEEDKLIRVRLTLIEEGFRGTVSYHRDVKKVSFIRRIWNFLKGLFNR